VRRSRLNPSVVIRSFWGTGRAQVLVIDEVQSQSLRGDQVFLGWGRRA